MKKIIVLISAIMALVTVFSFSASAASKWVTPDKKTDIGEYDYAFALVGDTQILTMLDTGNASKEEGDLPAEWKNQGYMDKLYQWIVDNKQARKIEYVVGLGDITENISNDKEWKLALNAISKLNGVVPYSLARGNHDGAAKFKQYMVDKNPGYIDQFVRTFGQEKINSAATLSVGGVDWLFITIGCDPTDNELKWAGDMAKQYPNHRVVLSTHYYLTEKGTIAKDVSSLKGPNSGQDIWDKVVSQNENIFMVLCGHVGVDTVVYSKIKRDSGSLVHQFLVNPQGLDFDEGPTGLVALLCFNENMGTFSIEYYSTAQDKYRTVSPYRVKFAEAKQTEAPETTAATPVESVENNTVSDDEIKSDNSGCSNAIALAVTPLVITIGAAAVALRKKHRK